MFYILLIIAAIFGFLLFDLFINPDRYMNLKNKIFKKDTEDKKTLWSYLKNFSTFSIKDEEEREYERWCYFKNIKTIGINNIYNIDCREGLKYLGNNSIDFSINDPPYYLDK